MYWMYRGSRVDSDVFARESPARRASKAWCLEDKMNVALSFPLALLLQFIREFSGTG